MLFAVDQEMTNVITLGGVIVTLAGVIAWVLKSALPQLMQAYRDETGNIRHEFREELALFRSDLKEISKANAETHSRLSLSVDKLADEISALKATHTSRV